MPMQLDPTHIQSFVPPFPNSNARVNLSPLLVRSTLLSLVLWLTVPLLACAGSAPLSGRCDAAKSLKQAQQLRLARIIAPTGAQTYWDLARCGYTLQPKCKWRNRLRRGQVVLVAAITGNRMCVSSDNDHSGWIHRSDAKLLPRQTMLVSDWLGLWRWKGDGDDVISIQRMGHGVLSVAGKAYWDGRPKYSVHYGGFSGHARPSGNHLSVTSGSCHVRLMRIGEWLVVADNHQCGGLNVNFDGMYWRHGAERPPKPRTTGARLRADAALLKHDIDSGALKKQQKSKTH